MASLSGRLRRDDGAFDGHNVKVGVHRLAVLVDVVQRLALSARWLRMTVVESALCAFVSHERKWAGQ